VPSDRTKGKRHKLKHRRFWLNEGALPYSEGDRALEQFAERDSGVFSSGDIQNPPGCHPVQCAVGDPAQQGSWTR